MEGRSASAELERVWAHASSETVRALVRAGGRRWTAWDNIYIGVMHFVPELVAEVVAGGASQEVLLYGLHAACNKCNAGAAEELLARLAPVCKRQLEECLHRVAASHWCRWRRPDALRLVGVLCRLGADIDYVDPYDQATALCRGVRDACVSTVAVFALRGANLHFAPDGTTFAPGLLGGQTPLEYAREHATADRSLYYCGEFAACAEVMAAVAGARSTLALIMACRRPAARRRLFLPPELWQWLADEFLGADMLGV